MQVMSTFLRVPAGGSNLQVDNTNALWLYSDRLGEAYCLLLRRKYLSMQLKRGILGYGLL
jgi:hypothetical protein